MVITICDLRFGGADPIVQSVTAVGSDPPAERRQHRAVDPALGHHVRQGEAALPRPGRPPGDPRDEHRPAADGRDRHRALRRAHEVRADARRRPPRRRDDAHPAARHLAVLARPRQPALRADDRRPAAGVLHAAAALPAVAVPGGAGAVAVPAPADDFDGHTEPRRGALARSSQGESGGHTTADEGSVRPEPLIAARFD